MTQQLPRVRQWLFTLLLLVGVAAVAAVAWIVVKSLLDHAAVAGPVIAASVALIVFAIGEVFTRVRVARQYRWEKIAPTYQEFVEMVRKINKQIGKGDTKPTPENVAFLEKFSDELVLWGHSGVIKAWVSMLRNGDKPPHEAENPVLEYARVLLAIRKELGHLDWTMEHRDLLRVVIEDIDKFLPAGTKL